jgi:hypothetical protein
LPRATSGASRTVRDVSSLAAASSSVFRLNASASFCACPCPGMQSVLVRSVDHKSLKTQGVLICVYAPVCHSLGATESTSPSISRHSNVPDWPLPPPAAPPAASSPRPAPPPPCEASRTARTGIVTCVGRLPCASAGRLVGSAHRLPRLLMRRLELPDLCLVRRRLALEPLLYPRRHEPSKCRYITSSAFDSTSCP